MTVLVSIGNSDDRLTQREWAAYHEDVDRLVRRNADIVHGAWVSLPTAPWQNAAWAFDLANGLAATSLRVSLRLVAEEYRQESIAWMQGYTEFLPGRPIEAHGGVRPEAL